MNAGRRDARHKAPARNRRWTGLPVLALGLALVLPAVPATLAAPGAPADAPVAPAPAASPSEAPCTCLVAQATNGWCERHQVGYIAGITIRSKVLFETLDAHGHQVDLTTFTCPSCRKAIETEGFCEEHKNGFVAKLAYFSRLTYELARGKVVDPATIACPVCAHHAKSHGWCAKHRLGMAGHFAIADREAFTRVEKALGVLEIANEAAARCEDCAVAIVTDTFCPIHRIRYRDGKALSPGTAPRNTK